MLEPFVQRRILLGKDLVVLYEAVQQFLVAEDQEGHLIGCGALHVIWEDLGEIRTLIVTDEWLHRGVGRALVEGLEANARRLGISTPVLPDIRGGVLQAAWLLADRRTGCRPRCVLQLIRSPDEGVAEFLDLAHVKPNTLGNTRMLKQL